MWNQMKDSTYYQVSVIQLAPGMDWVSLQMIVSICLLTFHTRQDIANL
jgi:hypothetical protein